MAASPCRCVAGGSSENSEALSLELLAACQGLRLWATEMQIVYAKGSALIDYLAVKKLPKHALKRCVAAGNDALLLPWRCTAREPW